VSQDVRLRQLQGVAKVPLSFAANWSNYGSGTGEEATYSRFGRLVVLQGLVTKAGTPAAADVIATLPAGFRPTGSVLFSVVTGGTTSFGAVRVNSSGQVEWIAGDTAESDFTSLSGITFVVDAD
jgi:hypothetical protein